LERRITPEPVIGPRLARTRWANSPYGLEQRGAQRGNTKVTLESTETARRFYLSNGYTKIGTPIEAFGTTSYPHEQGSLRLSCTA
jgi:hypothetical protein